MDEKPSTSELTDGLQGCIHLIEAWMHGPILSAGIRWASPDNHPPALRKARELVDRCNKTMGVG